MSRTRFEVLLVGAFLSMLLPACSPAATVDSTTPTSLPPSTFPTGDPAPIGLAYVNGLGGGCRDSCPGNARPHIWIVVDPQDPDYGEATAAFSEAYPTNPIGDAAVPDTPPHGVEFVEVERVDDRSNPHAVTIRVTQQPDRDRSFPDCIDVFLVPTAKVQPGTLQVPRISVSTIPSLWSTEAPGVLTHGRSEGNEPTTPLRREEHEMI